MRFRVGQCRNQTNRSVTTHAQIANVIEEDHTGNARRIHGFAEQSANHHVGTPRLIHYGGAKTVVPAAEAFQALGNGPASEVRGAAHHQASRLPSSMGIDDADSMALTHKSLDSALFSRMLEIRRRHLDLFYELRCTCRILWIQYAIVKLFRSQGLC